MSLKSVFLLVSLLYFCVDCKVYERCELANELKSVHKISDKELAIWVCIARHESEYNTTAVGHLNWDGSGDHGLFQISDLYWCSPPGNGWACGVSCQQLEDDDIKDDVECIKRIHRQHQRLSGDGFTAWAVYRTHCSSDKVGKYIEDCFNKTTEEADLNNEVIKAEKKKDVLVHSVDSNKDGVTKPDTAVVSNIVSSTTVVDLVNHAFVKPDVILVRPDEVKKVDRVETELVKDDAKTGFTKTESKTSVASGDVQKQVPKYETVINTGRHFGTFDKTKTKTSKRYNVKLYEFGSNVGLQH